ncbi:MAG: chromosomal replication initiator protein DnaA [Candidatus Saccharibacteria bacterium]|nr:chromosomal replication initiator protein DnaA [Candidatus Saccharibacteria bacterium]
MVHEKQFWARILELAHSQLKKTTFDFFVAEAKLIKVENKEATIHLDSPVKKLFWEQNLADIILTAGFEIYNDQIEALYIFEKENAIIEEPTSVTSYQAESQERQRTRPVSTGLKSKYTFENFVQGDGNQWAKAAALAVADNLGGIYNPLFIYGGPGLGKTHLLNAIGNEVLEHSPDARIKYVPAETFINDFLEHLRLGEMDSFKKIYRSLDLLLIDDIQALSKKVSTQEEFFNTFNALHGENKQIVLTSDRSPDYLENLEERLVTRFKWGLTSDITPPNFETRIAILRNKIEDFDLSFPSETIEYLAGQFDSNVRDLEGALKDINLLANMRQIKEITIDVAAEAIRSRKQDSNQVLVIPIDRIQNEVGNFYGVSVKEMKGTRRVQNIVLARQVAMYLTRELTDNSLPKIGREFGGKDHTTVIHAHGKIKSMLETDDNLRLEIESIKNKIK